MENISRTRTPVAFWTLTVNERMVGRQHVHEGRLTSIFMDLMAGTVAKSVETAISERGWILRVVALSDPPQGNPAAKSSSPMR